jgi:hypothetical protein
VSPTDEPEDEARRQRRLSKEQRKASSEAFELPMPNRLERKGEAPEREILTAKERLARERGRRDSLATVKVFLGSVAAIVVVLAIAFGIASVLDTSSPPKSAPWGVQGAPSVTPPPLSDQ